MNAPTHGGPRPGAGRKHLDGTPPGNDAADPAERHTVTMPASYWDVIKRMGNGSYSEGIRNIFDAWIDEFYGNVTEWRKHFENDSSS